MTDSMFNFGRFFTKKNAITFDLSEIEKKKNSASEILLRIRKMSKITRKKNVFPKNVSIKL